MNNKLYDRLKWVSLVLLPALAAAYFSLGQVWHLPYVEEVVGTLTIIDTFLGLILGKSSANYRRLTDNPQVFGDLVVVQDHDGVPTGKFRLVATEENPIFEEGRLAGFRVKREIEER